MAAVLKKMVDIPDSVYYNDSEVEVCSRHEEVLDKIPPYLFATDEDGNCESWKPDNIVTVLWHQKNENHWLPFFFKRMEF